MKISERTVRFILVFLIALSLYFSYNIWLSPASKRTVKNDTDTVLTENQNFRKEADAFLPLRMIFLQEGVARGTQSESVIYQVQSLLAEDASGSLQLVVDDEDAFESYQKLINGLELVYEGRFLLKDYLSIYGFEVSNIDIAEDFHITRVQVDFIRKKINFINIHKKKIYQLSFNGNEYLYRRIVKESEDVFHDMSKEKAFNNQQYNTKDSISLKKYSYILSTQSFTLFKNAFFQNPDDINNDNPSIYISGHERLEVNSDPQNLLVEFQGDLLITDEIEDDVYLQSFSYVRKLGGNVGNLRYFDREEDQVNYRVFVEGYPVFGELSRGLVSVNIEEGVADEKKLVQIRASSNTIQVPIPSDELIELSSTDSVQDRIVEAGAKTEKVSSIIIGYTWQAIKGNNRVVDLTPEWYIRYNKEWYSEAELLAKLPELEVD